MPNLADPVLTELRAWHDQQNPLLRALAEPMVEMMTGAVTTMQAVIDAQAVVISQLEDKFQVALAQVEAIQAAAATQAREHALSLQVTQDRIDQLERRLFGQQSERTKTPDARMEARKRRRQELSEAERRAQRDHAP